jgi:hypothetical protein
VNQLIQAYQFPVDERTNVTGSLSYTFSPVVGGYIQYSFSKRLRAGAGLRFQTRGYSVTIDGEERDPDFQYDERFSYQEKFRGVNLEIPLSAAYTISRRLDLLAGPVLGFSLETAPTVSMRMEEEIIVNGEISPLSAGVSENELVLSNDASQLYFGFMGALDYRVNSRTAISASYYLVSEYMNISGLGNLSDQSLSLTIKYDLFDF